MLFELVTPLYLAYLVEVVLSNDLVVMKELVVFLNVEVVEQMVLKLDDVFFFEYHDHLKKENNTRSSMLCQTTKTIRQK